MRKIETNDFLILNLSELTAKYRKYQIRGLSHESDLYYPNLKQIVRRLSYSLKKPVTTIEIDEIPYLIVRADAPLIPTSMKVVKGTVHFTQIGGEFTLDYTKRSPENDAICQKFLHFAISDELYKNPELWQPKAGAPFFKNEPTSSENGKAHHLGFGFKIVSRNGGLAIRGHIANKYLDEQPMPAILDSTIFEKWRNRYVIYRFGHRWYEAKAETLCDLNVLEYTVPDDDGKEIPLIEYVAKHSKKPLPPEVAKIPMDGSVIGYKTNRREDRAMPAGLCYQIYRASDEGMGGLHKKSLLSPSIRINKAKGFVSYHLSRVKFDQIGLKVSKTPVEAERKLFKFPDLLFGNSKILSLRGTPGAIKTTLENYGKMRLQLLSDRRAGFYETDPLGKQYLILPQSVIDSYGEKFKSDLSDVMETVFPQESRFEPEIIAYNDRVKKTLPHQGNAIREAIENHQPLPGHAMIMIHPITKRDPRDEDQLASVAVRKLAEFDVRGAVIHSTTTAKSYVMTRDKKGNPCYVERNDRRQRGVLKGYLQNVVLNKILLNNERWAFVLATRLHADLVIGIDVKDNTAGITVIGSNGEKIRSFCRKSGQKEQLTDAQIEQWLKKIIEDEVSSRLKKGLTTLRHIVIHRDGQIWKREIKGAEKAIKYLKGTGTLEPEASLTIVEIPKNLQTPMRFFETEEDRNGYVSIENPEIGLYEILDEKEGFVCTTGRAFPRKGTVEPLCVKRVSGELSIEQCMEDIFYLSALALTKPDDCSRYPLSIKLNDRALTDAATEFNEDDLEYIGSDENEEEEYESDGDFVRDVRRSA
jgi:hypothetical protein